MDNYSFFMQKDVSQYIGKWIAICDNKVVSSGESLKTVLGEAKKICPGKRPFVAKIPTSETMIL